MISRNDANEMADSKDQETPRSPAVGDIVHYTSYGTPKGEFPKTCRAAIVTETGVIGYFRHPSEAYRGDRIHDDCGRTWHDHGWIDRMSTGITLCPDQFDSVGQIVASLAVLNPEGLFFNKDVQHSSAKAGGTWHFPEDEGR